MMSSYPDRHEAGTDGCNRLSTTEIIILSTKSKRNLKLYCLHLYMNNTYSRRSFTYQPINQSTSSSIYYRTKQHTSKATGPGLAYKRKTSNGHRRSNRSIREFTSYVNSSGTNFTPLRPLQLRSLQCIFLL